MPRGLGPAAALATTCEAFCLRDLMPTVLMFYIVAHHVAVRSMAVRAEIRGRNTHGAPTCQLL